MDEGRTKMKGLILAAGLGERMFPLTREVPKPLLKINGIPILEYLIRLFKKHDIKEIGITTYYLKEKILDYFGDGKNFGVDLKYLEEESLVSSSEAVREISEILKDDLLICNGDNLTDINLGDLIRFHNENGADLTVVSYLRNPDSPPSSHLKFGKDQILKKFSEKLSEEELIKIPLQERYSNAGIYIFSLKSLKEIPKNTKNNISEVISLLLSKSFKVFAYPIKKGEYFKEVGKLERFYSAKKEIESKEVILKI
ncbi:MAG: NTP transferase domain-containing protein [Nanoarchaeota archaeon]|nr:NTP transferase domain-containing protein [Nanoarchaeota archaeon]